MVVILLTVGVFALFFLLVGVRLLLVKNGEFKGTCASQNPLLNKDGAACGLCGKKVEECPNNT